MKMNRKKSAAGAVMAAALLCAVSIGVNMPGAGNVFAATVTESAGTSRSKRPENGSGRGQNGERPEQKGTRYTGRITSLTASGITVELGEMKRPEQNAGNAAASSDGTADSAAKKVQRDRDPEDFITLTGETKTITISDSTKFRSRGKKNADGTEASDTTGEFTISDLAVGDYITFLADEDGTVLEVSKGIGMGGRGGRHDGKKPDNSAAAVQ